MNSARGSPFSRSATAPRSISSPYRARPRSIPPARSFSYDLSTFVRNSRTKVKELALVALISYAICDALLTKFHDKGRKRERNVEKRRKKKKEKESEKEEREEKRQRARKMGMGKTSNYKNIKLDK